MTPQRTYLACFSPTHTSSSIAQAIAEGITLPTDSQSLNATHQSVNHVLQSTDLLIAAVPVYGGAVAPIALKRLKGLQGEGTPAVVVTLYGNRDFGKAPLQLSQFLTQRGFNVIAAAAFVGEHSYSTNETPIATGRPHQIDLNEARTFGKRIANKLNQGNPKCVDASKLTCPPSGWLNLLRFACFVIGYRRKMKKHPVKIVPITDKSICNSCGRCAKLCPTDAIDAANPQATDAAKCIKCAACVKGCPKQARVLSTPFAQPLATNFKKPKPNVTLI